MRLANARPSRPAAARQDTSEIAMRPRTASLRLALEATGRSPSDVIDGLSVLRMASTRSTSESCKRELQSVGDTPSTPAVLFGRERPNAERLRADLAVAGESLARIVRRW